MALAVVTTGSVTIAADTATTDLSVAAGTDANLGIFCFLGRYTGAYRTITDLRWDPTGVNQALTQIATIDDGNLLGGHILYLKGLTANGTKNLRINWNTGNTGTAAVLAVVVMSGVDQTTAYDNGVANSDHNTANFNYIGASVTTADGYAWVGFCKANTAAVTYGASQTGVDNSLSSPQTVFGGLSVKAASSTSTTQTGSWTGTTTNGAYELNIRAAASGGGGPLFRSGDLNGIGSGGPFFKNPLTYHRHPTLSLEAYRREQAQKHREFMQRVRAA